MAQLDFFGAPASPPADPTPAPAPGGPPPPPEPAASSTRAYDALHLVNCPRCDSPGKVRSACTPIGPDGKSLGLHLIEIVRVCLFGHRWTERRARKDVCIHDLTSNVPCADCGRTEGDVLEARAAATLEGAELHDHLAFAGKIVRRGGP